jgi:hypothetical protein
MLTKKTSNVIIKNVKKNKKERKKKMNKKLTYGGFKEELKRGDEVVIEYPLDNVKENRVVLSSSRNILKTGRFITEEEKAEKLQNGSFEWEFEALNGKDYEIIVLNYPKVSRVKVNENSLELLSYIEDDYLFPFVAKEENEVWMRITA